MTDNKNKECVLYLKNRMGIVKMAALNGVAIIPTFTFNQVCCRSASVCNMLCMCISVGSCAQVRRACACTLCSAGGRAVRARFLLVCLFTPRRYSPGAARVPVV
jgi:hypothetical protein